jgi:hypothetical protein
MQWMSRQMSGANSRKQMSEANLRKYKRGTVTALRSKCL